jgi:hypothetical protein
MNNSDGSGIEHRLMKMMLTRECKFGAFLIEKGILIGDDMEDALIVGAVRDYFEISIDGKVVQEGRAVRFTQNFAFVNVSFIFIHI